MRNGTLQPRQAVRRVFRFLVPVVIAVCFWSAMPRAWAATHCVGTAVELQAALDTAAGNFTNDYVFVQRGTYTGNFSFDSYEHHPITIRGGYDPTCTTWVDDPSNTVLDAEGSGTVLSLYQHAGGGVSVEGLTIQNGGYRGLWVRLINEYADNSIENIALIHNVIKDCRTKGGVSIMSEPGDEAFPGTVKIYDNIIQGNIGERSGITVLASWALPGGYVVFRNNIIAGNIGTAAAGGVTITNYDTGNVYFTNNTIVDNETTTSLTAVPGGLSAGVGSALYAYNNIINGNASENGPLDLRVSYYDVASVGNAFSNIYTDMDGSWHVEGANISIDPDFVDPGFWHDNGTAGDPSDDYWIWGGYHIDTDSPCIDAGNSGPPSPGSLPSEDFEGDPRVVDGNQNQVATVDIGADESTVIFRNGFESGGASAWSDTVGLGP